MMEAMQWLEKAVAAAGMSAYAEGLDSLGNESATDNNQEHQADPPGNVH